MKAKRVLGILLACSLVTGMLAACGSGNSAGESSSGTSGEEASSSEVSESASSASDAAPETETAEAFSYPMEEVTLTINYTSDGATSMYDTTDLPEWCKDMGFQENLRQATGVTLEDIGGSPASADTTEEFLLMLASGDYSDIIYANWVTFPGGPSAALNDGYIVDLMEYAEYMPNLMAYLNENPEIKALVTTDDGQLYAAPYIKDDGLLTQQGLVLRQDWLDELDMELPETVEELHDVLVAFRDELGVVSPLTFECRWLFIQYGAGAISSGWNTAYPFYMDGDTVVYGPMTDEYKEYVTTLAKWYEEGLIDRDLATVDKSTVQAKFSNGEAGVSIQQTGNIDNCVAANEGTSFAVTPMESLVMNSGDEPEFAQYSNMFDGSFGFSVSTQCSNVEAACRWLDYFYSDEGGMLINYGLEGVSYEIVNDEVAFTDLILNNEETSNATTARTSIAHPRNWPHVQENSTLEYSDFDSNLLTTWFAEKMNERSYPTVTYTNEESEMISEKWSDIDTYAQEMITKFILGTESLDNWDSFISTLEQLGIHDILEARQAAYERYISR